MAEKLGFFQQALFGDWAERVTINQNAEDLSKVETNLTALHETVQKQAKQIMELRAMLMGVVDLMREKTPFQEAELERAVRAAWDALNPPPPPTQATDPYRGIPATTGEAEPSAEDVAAARALLTKAQDFHFSKRFAEARAIYQQVVDEYGATKQAAQARQQLDNLKNV